MTRPTPARPRTDPRDAEIRRLRTDMAHLSSENDRLTAQRDAGTDRLTHRSRATASEPQAPQRTERYAQALAETLLAITDTENLAEALHTGLNRLLVTLDGQQGAVYLLEPTTPHLHLFTIHHPDPAEIPRAPSAMQLTAMPLAQEALRTGTVVVTRCDPTVVGTGASLAFFGGGDTMIIPMIARGIPLGLICIHYPEPVDTPTPMTLDFARAIGTYCALAVHDARRDEARATERAQLQTILAMAPVDISIWDPAGHLVQANDAYDFGGHFASPPVSPMPESEGQGSFRVETEDGQVLDPADYPLRRVLRDGATPQIFLRNVYPDRAIQEFVAHARWASDRQSIVCIYQEVGTLRTALKRAATAQATAAALTEANILKDRFIALVAHDLRTPLTGIRGYAELLTMRDLPPHIIREYGAQMMRSAQRMQVILDAYLDIQRLEAGAVAFQPAWIDPATIVADAVAAIPPERVVTVTVEDSRVVWADAEQLRKVVDNVLSNALKFSSPPAPIAITIGTTDHMRVITVADQGIGIPRDAYPHMFEKFFRVRSADVLHQQPGTGLGLAISREIMGRMGGQISFESSATGTTFRIQVPVPDTGADLAPAVYPAV